MPGEIFGAAVDDFEHEVKVPNSDDARNSSIVAVGSVRVLYLHRKVFLHSAFSVRGKKNVLLIAGLDHAGWAAIVNLWIQYRAVE